AIIVEIPFLDLRFPFTTDLADLTVVTFLFRSETASFTDIDRFSKNREVQTRHIDSPAKLCSPYYVEVELVVSRSHKCHGVGIAAYECVWTGRECASICGEDSNRRESGSVRLDCRA